MSAVSNMLPIHGFILTRQQKERRGDTYIEAWIVTDEGAVQCVTEPQAFVFFIKQDDADKVSDLLQQEQLHFSLQNIALTTFQHEPVAACYFKLARAYYAARDALRKRQVVTFEADIRLPERYFMERFVYGSALCLGKHHSGRIEQAKFKASDYMPRLSAISVDIECDMEGNLFSIGLVGEQFSKVMMIASQEQQQAYPNKPEWLMWVESESALLEAFCDLIAQQDPDLLIGWNVINFDFRLLLKKAKSLGMKLKLGRDGSPAYWRDSMENNQGFVTIAGRMVIDGIASLKTATYQFDSFSLEHVSQALLGQGKLSDDVDNRVEHIVHDFHHNKVKLAEYNRQDCQLVLDIFAKTQLIEYLVLRSQLTGLELDRAGGSVAAFINQYLPKLHRAGYVSPNRPQNGGLASPGGYVMNSRPGLYKNVLVLDFKSLYPSIIRTFKIDPLGLIEGLASPDDAIEGFKGAKFSRDKHFLPDIITSLWQQRDQAKKDQDAARSQAIKIIMNSFYGVLGSGGCPFYDTRLASSITMRGHEIMQQTAKWIEEKGYEVIYGDTDSTFVWLEGDLTSAQAREVGIELQEMINNKWHAQIKQQHDLPCLLEIEFETHFTTFLMPTIRGSNTGSKKRYAGLIETDSGEKLVFKGLETVRSDWTDLAKEFQQTLYAKVFAGEPTDAYILHTIEQVWSGQVDKKLVYRKRLRQPLESYVKNVPPHVKAARIADQYLEKQGMPLRYQHKGWINYVITTAGPQPLECVTQSMDYQHYIDKQIQPIADSILPFVNQSFEQITCAQIGLF